MLARRRLRWLAVGTAAAALVVTQSPRLFGAPPKKELHTATGFTLRQRDGLDIEAQDYLGTPQSEAAVQRGLKWLAGNQSADGSWPGGADVGIVGLCAMSFLAAGHQPDRGPYGRILHNAADYLARNTA